MTKSTALCVSLADFVPMLLLSGSLAFAAPGKSAPAKRTLPTMPAINIAAAPYFAKGDGQMDNTAAINQALADAAASVPRKKVSMPLGTFAHSGVLRVQDVMLSGAGAGTILQATNPGEGSVELSGTDCGIQNCTLVSPPCKRAAEQLAFGGHQRQRGHAVHNQPGQRRDGGGHGCGQWRHILRGSGVVAGSDHKQSDFQHAGGRHSPDGRGEGNPGQREHPD